MEVKTEDKQQNEVNSSEESSSDSQEESSGVFGRSEYAKKDFWDERFKSSKGFFDWYLEYRELKPYFANIYPIKKESSILMVGCGNSRLSEEMYEDGFQNITNIDISSVVVENMKQYYETKNIKIECFEMDATNMTFKDGTFDVLIDKGTLDAIICGKNTDVVNGLMKEMTRVLKLEGELFIISHGQPKQRKELFRQAIDIDKFEFLYAEQRLSDISQLINIFRSKLKDKPLSQILKDKELLKESMAEFSGLRNKSLAQRILRIKQEMDRKKAQQEEAKNNPEQVASDKPAEVTVEKEKEVVENIEKADAAKPTEPKEKAKPEYAPQRQAHCFIYYIKKLRE